ncbi:MAG: bifunctional 5,10-methylenetetrahydrofolate dehydrogenase/5,10-methenyltetrahydrofolate cyclohydrolase [Actinobacteria bacterium]|nr:MAG: bifunctional 5,10-methylenetetrahydrofolate dehydrogenase/5,10-methenyltetrahydrofolate cyclohydrolase [Actinomycetota bacterium]
MTATIIDGKKIAAEIRSEVAERVRRLAARGVTPGFVDLLIGDDPASKLYVGMKYRAATEAGMAAFDHLLPAGAPAKEALTIIEKLNADPHVHGVIVQSPLPPESPIDILDLQEAIDPEKDVDGLHPLNQGRLAMGRPRFVPATPAGVVELLHREGIEVEGRRVVVVGRSSLVGRPLSTLLSLKAPGLNATVTLCHTGTRDLALETRKAEILVVAAGIPKAVTADMVTPGAVVIDVGTNKGPDGKLVGDVDFDQVSKVAAAITPVPGGVGPMTVAMLMANVATAAERAADRTADRTSA